MVEIEVLSLKTAESNVEFQRAKTRFLRWASWRVTEDVYEGISCDACRKELLVKEGKNSHDFENMETELNNSLPERLTKD